MRFKSLAVAATLLMLQAAASTDSAESRYTVEVVDKPVPDAIDDVVAEQLEPKAYQVSNTDGLVFEFWFVKELSYKTKPASYEVAIEALPEVTLLGAAVMHAEEHQDFREDIIDPGAYVMRHGLQPQDGNHMGTSPTDTFAVLVIANRDADVRQYPTHEDMVEISLEHTATAHPPILSLQPVEDTGQEFPYLTVGGDDWEFLCVKVPAKAGEETFDVTMKMVIEGIGYL